MYKCVHSTAIKLNNTALEFSGTDFTVQNPRKETLSGN